MKKMLPGGFSQSWNDGGRCETIAVFLRVKNLSTIYVSNRFFLSAIIWTYDCEGRHVREQVATSNLPANGQLKVGKFAEVGVLNLKNIEVQERGSTTPCRLKGEMNWLGTGQRDTEFGFSKEDATTVFWTMTFGNVRAEATLTLTCSGDTVRLLQNTISNESDTFAWLGDNRKLD